MDIKTLVPGALPGSIPKVTAPVPGAQINVNANVPEPAVRDVVEISAEAQVRTAVNDPIAIRSENVQSGLRLHFDEAAKQVVVEILNANNEVIKQLPPEESLRIAARFREITGLIFDQEV